MPFKSLRDQRIILAAMILTLPGGVAVFAARYFSIPPPAAEAGTGSSGNYQSPRLQAIRFVITPRGIEPAELSITPGQYWVAIDNDLHLKETNLNIDRIGGPRIKSGKNFQGRRKFREFVEFSVGEYLVSETSHPGLQSKITVSAQK